jgi:hypothetical protein
VTTHYWLQNEHLRNADRAEHYLDRVLEIAPDAVEAKTNSRVLRVTPTALRAGRIPKVSRGHSHRVGLFSDQMQPAKQNSAQVRDQPVA